jgi:FKBP-type peptidyl-prolyl cis-trans isomerase FkpA
MQKIKVGLLLLITMTGIFGCKKSTSCTPKTVASEVTTMQNFANANGITVQTHSSGMLYQIVNPGTGLTPSLTSRVSVRYTGKLMNGTIFDSNTGVPVQFLLNQVIAGWQLGLPLIKKGGTIRLIIPSSLAYGCSATGPIPGDAVLYFEIELVDVL